MVKLQCTNCGDKINVKDDDVIELRSGGVVISASASRRYECAGCGVEYIVGAEYAVERGSSVVVTGNGNVVSVGGGIACRGDFKGNIVL